MDGPFVKCQADGTAEGVLIIVFGFLREALVPSKKCCQDFLAGFVLNGLSCLSVNR